MVALPFNWGGTAGWQTALGGAGAVNTIRMNYLSGGNVNVAAAIRITTGKFSQTPQLAAIRSILTSLTAF